MPKNILVFFAIPVDKPKRVGLLIITEMMDNQTTEREMTMKARYMVIANGKEYMFDTLAAARYFAAEHNTNPIRVNRKGR